MAVHRTVSLEPCQQLEACDGKHSHLVGARCVLPPGVQARNTTVYHLKKYLAQHPFASHRLPHKNSDQSMPEVQSERFGRQLFASHQGLTGNPHAIHSAKLYSW